MRIRMVAVATVIAVAGCNAPESPAKVAPDQLYGDWIGRSVYDEPSKPCESKLTLRSDRTLTAEKYPADLDDVLTPLDATGTWKIVQRNGVSLLSADITEVGTKRGIIDELRFVDAHGKLELQLLFGDPDSPDQVCRFRRS